MYEYLLLCSMFYISKISQEKADKYAHIRKEELTLFLSGNNDCVYGKIPKPVSENSWI